MFYEASLFVFILVKMDMDMEKIVLYEQHLVTGIPLVEVVGDRIYCVGHKTCPMCRDYNPQKPSKVRLQEHLQKKHNSNMIVVWVINRDITFLKGKSPGHHRICTTCGLYVNATNRFHSVSCGSQKARGRKGTMLLVIASFLIR